MGGGYKDPEAGAWWSSGCGQCRQASHLSPRIWVQVLGLRLMLLHYLATFICASCCLSSALTVPPLVVIPILVIKALAQVWG